MELTNPDIYESGEDYLERILMLEESKGVGQVHAIDLAQSFGYSKPSVSLALKKLKATGYLTFGGKDQIILSEKGRALGSKTYERHQVIGAALISLGVEETVAYKDACKMEHDLSEETFQALKKHYLQKQKR
ncbi:MAG: Transcriptional regulator MntR [Tenericutes bacterium ADurb.BinA155]|jgi:DtxR family transcriptional regulator, Mn-dependent transcriptional regulator|nr:MAG: Transcriptional regulator MntR [Tenericutes bacterium ADurb.BinA155]